MLAMWRRLIWVTVIGTAMVAFGGAFAFGQAAGSKQAEGVIKEKQWKDRAEYDLYDSIVKDNAPAGRLTKLDQWTKQYSTSDYAATRRLLYLNTYQRLNRPADGFAAAKQILNDDPNNLRALSAEVYDVFQLKPPSEDDLTTGQQAATKLLSDIDTLFGLDKKPQGVSDADWNVHKHQMQVLAQNALGWIAMQRKDWTKAEAEFRKSLQFEPSAGQVSSWLGTVILAQKDPNKQVPALYEFARAISVDGAGALDTGARKQLRDYLEKAYTQYHGSNEGLDQLIAAAKSSALPPPDFRVKSTVDIAKEKEAQEEAFAKANPMMALWKDIKAALTAPDGQQYFDQKMKDALLPGGVKDITRFKGRLISMTPAARPKELVLAIENPNVGDVRLKLDTPLTGRMDRGTEISFEGVAVSFTADPFMVTFKVEKSQISGWAPKREPATTRRKSSTRGGPEDGPK